MLAFRCVNSYHSIFTKNYCRHYFKRSRKSKLFANPKGGCGLATVQIDGIKHDEFEGIRVTPNVYSTLEEVDRFADAMETVIKEGLPKT